MNKKVKKPANHEQESQETCKPIINLPWLLLYPQMPNKLSKSELLRDTDNICRMLAVGTEPK